nr:putative ribonuclease H-like domain-containing protein [Tanacetum cinerariifolium]
MFFMPPKPDLSYIGLEEFTSEPVVETLNSKTSEEVPKSINKLIDSQIVDNYKKGLGYNTVPPRYTGFFMPPKPDLSYIGLEEFTSEPVVETLNSKTSEEVPKMANHKNFAKNTHPCPKRNIVSKAVLMKSGIKLVNAARQKFSKVAVTVNTARLVNTDHLKTTMNAVKPRVNTVRNKHVNTAKPKVVLDAAKGNEVYAVKASACWVWKPWTKVIDHVSKYNSALITLKKFDYVDAQGRSKVPRKNNMYSVDLTNIIPKGGLTCLFAKATSDESITWHRRLGHLNFKTINKLVKGNLVRGLPSNVFENEQTCVACQKGKQHRASCNTKTENFISLPLHMLHMDLFGLTFVKSLIKKMYCIVVTDDYSRFTWFFFLSTNDETSRILKSFITRIKNLVDHKVKVIRCHNGTEFKNRDINQFCKMKGIMRQYSVAMTPQQNGVAERRNITLIEAARTMLADSKLPTTFWAEAVSTSCYVQNRVVFVKPHNKTLYELFHDQLDKFDGKADEEFFIRYSLNSKAFRVFNIRTRIVEETLHISQARHEKVPGKDYILLPLWTADLPFLQEPKSSQDVGFKPSNDVGKNVNEVPRQQNECKDQEERDSVNSTNRVNINVNEVPRQQNECKDQEERDSVNSTNRVNIVSSTINAASNEVNAIGIKSSIELPNDLNMPGLEDITIFEDSNKDMDVKSAFLYGKIKEEVYVCQPPGFEDPYFPDKVYKVEKVLYGLHQAPRAWYETLSTYLLDNGFHKGKIDKTLFIRRHKDDILLVQVYVDDIIFGSTKKELCNSFEKLMYDKFQMSSMRELTFFLGLQVKQKEDGIFINQDKYVAEILKKFRFFEVKTSSKPIETQKPLLKDEEGEEVDPTESKGFKKIIDFLNAHSIKYTLTVNPTIYTLCIEQFWATTKVKNINREAQLHAKVDGKKVVISEASIRRDLWFGDEGGIDCLPNEVIFEQLTLMRYESILKSLLFIRLSFLPNGNSLFTLFYNALVLRQLHGMNLAAL